MMRRKLQQNRIYSLFAVIPSEIVDDLGLEAGDVLDFTLEGDCIKARRLVYPSCKTDIQATTHEPIKEGAGNV